MMPVLVVCPRRAREQLVRPGAIERYRSTRAWWNSIHLPAGSRLRLIVGPVDAEWWQRNFNSGGRLGHETAADARVATVGIHFGASAGSTIELPIAPAAATVAETDANDAD